MDLIRVHEMDNVAVALRPLPEGSGWTPPWRRETVSGVHLPG